MPDATTVVPAFQLLAKGVDVSKLKAELDAHPDLWDAVRYRKDGYRTPHSRMSDIWVRYNDIRPYEERGDFTGFNDRHVPIWYPAYYLLPELRRIIHVLAAQFQAEMIGGVLITRIPPGEKIDPHTDEGWHVDYYDKLYLSIEAGGAEFSTATEKTVPEVGDLWLFDNKVEHWVINDSPVDRVTLIVCLRTAAFGRIP